VLCNASTNVVEPNGNLELDEETLVSQTPVTDEVTTVTADLSANLSGVLQE